MTKTDTNRITRINQSPRTARIVGSYALIAMHGWFFAKLGLPSEDGAAEVIVGLAALTGMITSILFFLGTYGVMANAPDTMLDERELADRNRAYFSAFKYLVAMALLGGVIPEFLAKAIGFELSVGVLKNYIFLIFTTALVLPGFFLACSAREEV